MTIDNRMVKRTITSVALSLYAVISPLGCGTDTDTQPESCASDNDCKGDQQICVEEKCEDHYSCEESTRGIADACCGLFATDHRYFSFCIDEKDDQYKREVKRCQDSVAQKGLNAGRDWETCIVKACTDADSSYETDIPILSCYYKL